MKNKIVVWGTNAENEKVLIALELRAEDNKIMLYTFPETVATEEFVNQMMNDWRTDNAPVEFPDPHTSQERELSVTEGLLPDELKVERGDLIQRAQTEWHFVVLSSKLHAAYEQELAEFKEKVQSLSEFDNDVWESLRSFWDKVQEQARERNLFRSHADSLRDNINVLFEDMKKLRSKLQSEFMAQSEKLYEEFSASLETVEARIASGSAKMGAIFDDLKKLQRKYRDSKMGNEHRNKLWSRLDGAFKKAKELKFGPGANDGSLVERHQRRLNGLNDAIRRMEGSIRRDEEELAFQQKKVASTEGQLEAQIRSAKIKMIEERVHSKREKLNEMLHTRAEVERQIANAKEKEAKRSAKADDRKKFEAAKQAAKEEIAAITAPAAETAPPAAEPAETAEPEKEDVFKSAAAVLSESLEDMIDSAKAVGQVLSEKAADLLDDVVEKADALLGDVVEKAEEIAETLAQEHNEAPTETTETPAPEAEAPAATPKAKAAKKTKEKTPESAAAEPAKKPAKAKAAPKKKAGNDPAE